MSVVVQLLTRAQFDVQAVRVTAEDIEEIAVWCKGQVYRSGHRPHIKLDIPDAKSSVRQQAFPGDWILLSDQGYRIYTNRALESNFVPKINTTLPPKEEIDAARRAAIKDMVYKVILDHSAVDHSNSTLNTRVVQLVDNAVEEILRAS